MIWGGAEEISEMNLFFPGNPFRIKFFSSAKPLKIYFFLGKASQNLFSQRVPLKIYFFLERGHQNYFFLDFLRPHPQIITGRPLSLKVYVWKTEKIYLFQTFSTLVLLCMRFLIFYINHRDLLLNIQWKC